MAKQTFTTGQVLTAAQMTSLQQTAMLGGAASAKTASYTLVAADAGSAISMSNASATTITVNTALFAAGDTVQITNLGAGVCTITAGTATVNSSASLALAQYESGTLDFTSTSSAIFIKGAGAAAGGGLTWTLLNSGGTALTGAQDITISSINAKEVLILIKAASSANAASEIGVRINGSTTNSDYSYFGSRPLYTASYSAPNFGAEGQLGTGATYIPTGAMGNNSLDAVQGSVHIANADTTGFKRITTLAGANIETANGYHRMHQGLFFATAAVTSITLRSSTGNFDDGTLYVYGAN